MVKVYRLAVIGLLFMAMTSQASEVVYTADNTGIFANPERGFLHQCTRHANSSYNAITNSRKTDIEKYMNQDKVSLILVLYYLDEFNHTETLPEAVLTAFDQDMQVLRDYGLKCILRIAYAEYSKGSGSEKTAEDAPLSIIEKHIAQYKSHWTANADVIYVMQAGFVGQYGEWYYTENFGNHVSTINDDCSALLDTVLEAMPHDRCLLLRRPMFKMEYLDGVALTAEDAYTDTKKARLGHFNDAFLYNEDNMGTYSSNATKRAQQKAFIAQETLYVPLGGETDITDAEQAQTQASYEATTTEMSNMHWSFIKNTYSETVTNMWRENGTFDELNRKLGYRYQLVNGSFSDEVAQGGKLSVNLQIRNVGYAPLYNYRPAYIVLKGAKNTEYRVQIESDPRTWLPNGVVSVINEQLTIPASVPQGTYNLYLYLPDAYASLADDARYAVRFANEDVWDAETGMNDLGATVTVTEPAYVPGTPIALPATFDKANVTEYSTDMTWYNTDYFDFGPTDAYNTDRWAEWTVKLKYPGEYRVSAEGYYPNGHQWQLSLIGSGAEAYALPASWKAGNVVEEGTTYWNLSGVAKGNYTLRVQNIMEWGQPKLKSLTLNYNGEIPMGMENGEAVNGEWTNGYDILGRPIDASYKGIVVLHGKKILNR